MKTRISLKSQHILETNPNILFALQTKLLICSEKDSFKSRATPKSQKSEKFSYLFTGESKE
jgi:hypothetical protein